MKKFFQAIGWIVFYMIFQMLVMSAAVMVLGSGAPGGAEAFLENHLLGLTIGVNILFVAVIGLMVKIRRKDFFGQISLRAGGGRVCFWPCIIAFAYSMVFALLTCTMEFENAVQVQTSSAYYSQVLPGLGVGLELLALLVVAPVTEELLCRGLVLKPLREQYGNTLAVLISGLLFGLMHGMAGGILLVAGSALMGIILGTICVQTNSLLPAIFAHAAANVPDFILQALPGSTETVRILLIVLFGALLAFSWALFLKQHQRG